MDMALKLAFLQLQAGAAVLLLLALRPCLRRLPRVCSYLLWLPVFVRLLCPISLEVPFGLMPSAAQGEAWLNAISGQRIPINEAAEILWTGDSSCGEGGSHAGGDGHAGMQGVPGKDSSAEQPDMAGAGSSSGGGTAPDSGSSTASSAVGYILTALWAAGAAVVLACNGVALKMIKRQIQKAEPLRENIYTCSQVRAPFTLGLIRPKIYVPDTLAGEELEYIICHEKLHIRRKDYLIKNLAFLATAAYWFNPLVWTAFCFMERDMEMSCDEAVLREKGEEIKRSYSQSLLDFAGGKCPAAVTPLTYGENSVKQRVKNVLDYKKAKKWTFGVGIVVLLAVTVMLFTVRGTQAREDSGSNAENGGLLPEEGTQGKARDYDLLTAQSSAHDALECWAEAFADRDGNTLYQLALDKENFERWDMVYKLADGSYAFGDSSPWATGFRCHEDEGEGGSFATVVFDMTTSVPEQYILMERVNITEAEGQYYVDHVSAWDNYVIETAQEYADAYAEGGICDGWYAGYDISFYQQIQEHLSAGTNPSFYVRYTDPVSAAKALMHLGSGAGEVTQWDIVPMGSGENHIAELPEGTGEVPAAGGGSRAVVTYTFWKDGSSVEILMELKEAGMGILGIWGPVGREGN